MKINENSTARTVALALTLGVGLLGQTTFAQAQSAMAPPVSSGAPAQGQSVYQWSDVPVNQQVQITRAVFDQGGYQLYASTGETIVVPFANQNLYVMKFGQTSGGMYFVNDGSAPTLFIPAGGYLENAAASGAHWYPFPQHFAYTQPVYEGIAPTWDAYIGMGWYPGMVYYGGYYGYHPWHLGLSFSPFPGLYFNIGGHPYYGWNAYHSYYGGHPYGRVFERSYAPYRGYGIAHRGPAYFGSHAAFGHAAGYYNSHGSFGRAGAIGHAGGAFGGRAAAVHGGAFGHASVGGHAFGGATGHAGAFGHAGGSFGHSTSGFGGGRASTSSFGHGGGSFGHSAPAGGSHGAFGGGGASHGSFGGGASHGSFGGGGGSHGSVGGGGGSHGSFGGGGGSHGGGGDHGGGGGSHGGGGGSHH